MPDDKFEVSEEEMLAIMRSLGAVPDEPVVIEEHIATGEEASESKDES